MVLPSAPASRLSVKHLGKQVVSYLSLFAFPRCSLSSKRNSHLTGWLNASEQVQAGSMTKIAKDVITIGYVNTDNSLGILR